MLPGSAEPPRPPDPEPPGREYARVGGRGPRYLLSEDRHEYERLLDEALRTAPRRPDPAGRRPGPEQLRAMALAATTVVAGAATAEYASYVGLREELRRPPGRTGAAADAGPAGAGAAAVVAVLTPVLAGTAAAIFLGLGYLLEVAGRASSFSGALLATGWVFGAITAAAILVAAACLLVTALRNTPAPRSEAYRALAAEVDRAREVWRAALLERGIRPFLRDALADPAASPVAAPAAPGRVPEPGYGRPGLDDQDGQDGQGDEGGRDTQGGEGAEGGEGSEGGGSGRGARPRFTSPDYTGPHFTGPDFTSPDFTGPGHGGPESGRPEPGAAGSGRS
ncbi:transmembrane protein [Streptomyces zinciresistens K42]|uniref:Transmembrane protein n=1 Tax=Streptomyces zinciresistens K42 TaxID=700597 RepID=G2G525_9ACTN|nr:transmembrane protein [Streptomyces zinciresistens K42]